MNASLKWVAAAVASLVPGCKDETPDPGEVVVETMVGPEGGVVAGAGVTLTLPPGALPAMTAITLRAAGDNLSASSYRQSGGAFQFEPLGLELALPGTLAFSDGPSDPAVLFKQDGMTVAGAGLTTYVNELGLVAVANAGVPLTNATAPVFSPTPEGATTINHDAIHFELQVTETPRVNVVLTLYDYENLHTHDLNGSTGEGDCGLELETPTGASLTRDCGSGPLTGQMTINSPTVAFDAVPDLSGRVNPAVPVGVILGGEQLAYFMGFVAFDTSACYQEICDNQGMCVVDAAGAGSCMCNEGFAVDPADPYSCNCVPACDGRECGADNCGGECGLCPEGDFCDDQGQCQTPDPTGDTDPTSDTDDPTMGSTDGSSTTMGDTDTDTDTGTGTASG